MFKNRKIINKVMFVLAIIMVTGMVIMVIAPAIIGN